MDIFNESLTSVRNKYLNNNSSPSLQRDSRRQLDLMLVLFSACIVVLDIFVDITLLLFTT